VEASEENMKWVVLGSNGQLGKTLVNTLNKKRESVFGFDRKDIDITQPKSLEVIASFCPDILVNCAAFTDVDKAEDKSSEAMLVNCEGAENVAKLAKKIDALLMHISTDYVFSGKGYTPWKVSDIPSPMNQYGLSKYFGEKRVLETYPDRSIIFRTAWLYSAEGGNFVKKIIKKILRKEKKIEVVQDQIGQPTSAISLCEQIYLVSKSKIYSGVLHATNSGEVSRFELAKRVVQLMDVRHSTITPILLEELRTGAKRPRYLALDHSYWNTLGLSPMCDWQTALAEALPEIESRVSREIQNG
jgi:dTDP-4-dehydrorhamnose reductase